MSCQSPRLNLLKRAATLTKLTALAFALGLGAMALNTQQLFAQQDVVVSHLSSMLKHGTVGGITAYSLGTTACNIGDEPAIWIATTNEHPVIAQNLYRLENNRFEQIGMSWLKHAFCATNEPGCGTCQTTNCDTMGVECSDTYGSQTNAAQASLGPRSEVNATTGESIYPWGAAGMTGDAIYKRLQVHNTDLDPSLHPTASYFGEGLYITSDEPAVGTDDNNGAWREVEVGNLNGGGYSLGFTGSTASQEVALYAWKEANPAVQLEWAHVPGEGSFLLGSLATDLGNGSYEYEYALFNYNSHRSAGSFTIQTPASSNSSNLGFHDVDYHSGEPYDLTDWGMTSVPGLVEWRTEDFSINPNANALRWGTLYNFRFVSDTPPGEGLVEVGLFRPFMPTSIQISARIPVVCVDPFIRGDVNDSGSLNLTDVISLLSFLFSGGSAPIHPDSGDLNSDSSTNLTDAVYALAFLFTGGPAPAAPYPGPGCP